MLFLTHCFTALIPGLLSTIVTHTVTQVEHFYFPLTVLDHIKEMLHLQFVSSHTSIYMTPGYSDAHIVTMVVAVCWLVASCIMWVTVKCELQALGHKWHATITAKMLQFPQLLATHTPCASFYIPVNTTMLPTHTNVETGHGHLLKSSLLKSLAVALTTVFYVSMSTFCRQVSDIWVQTRCSAHSAL